MSEVDTSALSDDPILRMAKAEYERFGGDWDTASLDDRRYFISEATKRWMDSGYQESWRP